MIKISFRFFYLNANQLKNLKTGIILFIFLVLILGFVQNNLSDYKSTLEQKRNYLRSLREKKVEQFLNYRVYGARGFRLFFQPAPISNFFIKSMPIPDMNAFADSTEQLNFYKPINTKTVFELRKNWFTDYSGILLLIGSLLSLFYAFQSLK